MYVRDVDISRNLLQVTLIQKVVKRGRRDTGYHIHPRRSTGNRGLLKKETTWSFFSDRVEVKEILENSLLMRKY